MGVRYVVLAELDNSAGQVKVVAFSGGDNPAFQKGRDLLAKVLPQFDMFSTSFPPDVNPHSRAVYIEGVPVEAPVKHLSAGVINAVVLNAGNMVGFRFGLVCPVKIIGQVVGSISFYAPTPLSERHREAGILISEQAEHIWQSQHQGRLPIGSDSRTTGRTGPIPGEVLGETAPLAAGAVRNASIPREPVHHRGLTFDPRNRSVSFDGRVLDLTRREYMLLGCLLNRRGTVLGTDALFTQAWGRNEQPDADIVDAVVSRLRRKLEGANAVDFIQRIRGRGYVLR